MHAGASAFTKFPATKQFGTNKAKLITQLIKQEKREFTSNLTTLPDIDWNAEINQLPIEEKYKQAMREKITGYLEQFKNPTDKDKETTILE